MVTVRVEPADGAWTCRVTVDDRGERTEHVVTVTRADLERWGRGLDQPDVEDLVKRSFDFLLEREPPSSILKTFDISVVQRYFPEYDRTFRRSS